MNPLNRKFSFLIIMNHFSSFHLLENFCFNMLCNLTTVVSLYDLRFILFPCSMSVFWYSFCNLRLPFLMYPLVTPVSFYIFISKLFLGILVNQDPGSWKQKPGLGTQAPKLRDMSFRDQIIKQIFKASKQKLEEQAEFE